MIFFLLNYFGWFCFRCIGLHLFYNKTKLYPYILQFYEFDINNFRFSYNCGLLYSWFKFLFFATAFILILWKIFFSIITHFGFNGYPLYLIHENTMMALIIKMQATVFKCIIASFTNVLLISIIYYRKIWTKFIIY
jgi:hypothetical protein